MSTTLSKVYRVRNDETPVTLAINIGHAQNAVTTLNLSGEELARDLRDSFSREIGAGKDLNGKTLYCTTVVADVRTETNETSVTYQLNGGPTEYRKTMQETVEKEGGVAFYTAVFDFFA